MLFEHVGEIATGLMYPYFIFKNKSTTMEICSMLQTNEFSNNIYIMSNLEKRDTYSKYKDLVNVYYLFSNIQNIDIYTWYYVDSLT